MIPPYIGGRSGGETEGILEDPEENRGFSAVNVQKTAGSIDIPDGGWYGIPTLKEEKLFLAALCIGMARKIQKREIDL